MGDNNRGNNATVVEPPSDATAIIKQGCGLPVELGGIACPEIPSLL
jgi:hypothetical protein